MFRPAAGIAGCFLRPGGDALSWRGKRWYHEPTQSDKGHQHCRKKKAKLETNDLIKDSFTMDAGACFI